MGVILTRLIVLIKKLQGLRDKMKIVKTASGKRTIKISKSEWLSIGNNAGWVKEAKSYDVEYSPDFTSPEVKKRRVRVEPKLVPEGMVEPEYIKRLLRKQEGKDVVVHKIVPLEIINKKKGPSKRDLQRARGEKMRKERQRRLYEQQQKQWLDQKKKEYGLPKDVSPEILDALMEIQSMGEAGDDIGLIELLKSRQGLK